MTAAVSKRTDLAGLPGSVTKTSLSYHEGVTYEQWSESLELLGTIGQGVNYWIGDAINWGEALYGERYTQAIELLRIADQTALNIAYTCRQVAPNRRRERLSFSHHAEVASLAPADQTRWLKRADDGEALPGGGHKPWSVKTLRAEIQSFRSTKAETSAGSMSAGSSDARSTPNSKRSGNTSTPSPAEIAKRAGIAVAAPAATKIDRLSALENLARVVKKILDMPKLYFDQPTRAMETLGAAYSLLESTE